MECINVVGVQFRRAGKIYDFSAPNTSVKIGDHVVVDTERGASIAKIVTVKYSDKDSYGETGIKPILRVASTKDIDLEGKFNEDKVMSFSRERIARIGLEMRVMKAEAQFGGNKITIYFTAPGRVDFRDLVKDLAGGLKARVELKQVGARDEAKLVGGMGICGREYCCSSFLREFVPVSIKMAKNQNLALNPNKVSGGCGRLLCCLTYENDTYTDLRKRMPPYRSRVKTFDGLYGDVVKADLLNQVCVIEAEDGQQHTVPVNRLEVVKAGEGVEEGEWGQDIDLKDLE